MSVLMQSNSGTINNMDMWNDIVINCPLLLVPACVCACVLTKYVLVEY